jgi:alpha-galactosidase
MKFTTGKIRYRHEGVSHFASFSLGGKAQFSGLTVKSELKVHNNYARIKVILEPHSDIHVDDLYLTTRFPFRGEERIFCNGYQTWTDSRELTVSDSMPRLWKAAATLGLKYHGDAYFRNYEAKPGIFHGYTYGYIRDREDVHFVGSLSEEKGFTILEIDCTRDKIHIARECNNLLVDKTCTAFNLVSARGTEDEVFSCYFSHIKDLKPKKKPCTGWTSWYNYYTEINESILLENLNALSDAGVPIDVFQVDDGYQEAVGDWLDINNSFPNGMKVIADAVHDRGYKAGLWLAPFTCERKSKIFREKPHWIIRDAKGRAVPSGFNPKWSYHFYGLDIYHEEVRHYLRDVFAVVFNDWRFDMVKLDFLYGAALCPPEGKTRGEVMTDAMKFLRECAGKKEILGCGVPLGPAFGQVDYCRIGSDIGPKWEDWLLNTIHYRERISTINSLNSTIGRRHLNGNVFGNDPDVFILRSENNSLTAEQKYTLFMVNNLFGSLVFTSDNIAEYDAETMKLYLSMFPLKEKKISSVTHEEDCLEAYFSIDHNSYVLFSNMGKENRLFHLPSGYYFMVSEKEGSFLEGDCDVEITSYSTRCFLKVPHEYFKVAGSTGHLFPGSDIEKISVSGNSISVSLEASARGNRAVYITVPGENNYRVNGHDYMSQQVCDARWVVKWIPG